ncbi:hypothetical protein ACGFJT_44405 [Actinomadura geliboluensis]|uniref:hypothetical protein n=1 Tax=Actinomadura geliboluensis TaxID=882440 RepID=UPI0037135220
MDAHSSTLHKALELARKKYPNVAPELHTAFANTVAFAVTGVDGGFGPASCREHLASRKYILNQVTYEQATREMLDPEGPIFGPLTEAHREVFESESCHNDAPADREALGY